MFLKASDFSVLLTQNLSYELQKSYKILIKKNLLSKINLFFKNDKMNFELKTQKTLIL